MITDLMPTLVTRFEGIGWDVMPSGCWEWRGSRHIRGGYGQISGTSETGPLKAHRVAYELTHGAIHDGQFICHSCDNPPCVNPAHLFSGTPKDNSEDMWEKGRGSHMVMAGEACPASRLTWEKVQEIRNSTLPLAHFANAFGVSIAAISKVRRGETWKAKSEWRRETR